LKEPVIVGIFGRAPVDLKLVDASKLAWRYSWGVLKTDLSGKTAMIISPTGEICVAIARALAVCCAPLVNAAKCQPRCGVRAVGADHIEELISPSAAQTSAHGVVRLPSGGATLY